jgi:D-aspartate ligase
MRPLAVVMNMFYTGLGIARSLGEQGIPVIGLTSRSRIYGNYTRYAKLRVCPDSREQPDALLAYLLELGEELGKRAVMFPTRDDDVLFLDRYRDPLSEHFALVIPQPEVVAACLDKWATYLWAGRAGVPSPRCWMVQNQQDLSEAVRDLSFPCVMKPISSHLWKQNHNWETVGGRKAFAVYSKEELFSEYIRILHADPRILLQEMIPGGDDQLFVAACYLDEKSNVLASFTAQKLLQSPATFGTGCIVQSTDRPELIEPAVAMLRAMGFTGIAEVEFKWDARSREFKLIEINPRPWDQHRLGNACGADLIHMTYCEHAGLTLPPVRKGTPGHKWVAEDALFMAVLRMLWRRDPNLGSIIRLARGKRIYGIWSSKDKRPFLCYMLWFLPGFAWTGLRHCAAVLLDRFRGKRSVYERHLQAAKTKTY